MNHARNILLWALLPALMVLELALGSVPIPFSELIHALSRSTQADQGFQTIIWDSRIPRTLAACLTGASLAWSGMLMQTLFRNPLAGPSMLGITSGASLGVALMAMTAGARIIASDWGVATLASAAFFGALLSLGLVLLVARRISDQAILLIFGIMLSFFTSAVVDALQSKATNEALRSYIQWGLGSFANCDFRENALIAGALLVSLIISLRILPRLNLMLLGDHYALTMGVNVNQTRRSMIIIAGLLSGIATAFCGPIAFIGLAVPHLSRKLMNTADHRQNLVPNLLIGGCTAMLCDLVSRMTTLPLNTIASALGAPFVIILLLGPKTFKSLV
ncbi:MAG: FecCD family ABC transporter permease [Flavobacteriales bacterium]